jgi:hypothetical protein
MSSGYSRLQPPGMLRLWNNIGDGIDRHDLLQRLLRGSGRGQEPRYSCSVQHWLSISDGRNARNYIRSVEEHTSLCWLCSRNETCYHHR